MDPELHDLTASDRDGRRDAIEPEAVDATGFIKYCATDWPAFSRRQPSCFSSMALLPQTSKRLLGQLPSPSRRSTVISSRRMNSWRNICARLPCGSMPFGPQPLALLEIPFWSAPGSPRWPMVSSTDGRAALPARRRS